MIEKKIKRFCLAKGINTAYRLQVVAGLNSTVAYSLFNETFTRISEKTLDKLCATLECQPGDLLGYKPSKGKAK